MNDQAAIKAAIAEFIKAYNAGDIAGVTAYYGDDIIKVRNGARPEMKPEVVHRLTEVFNKYHSRVEVVIDEIFTFGDLAFTRGSYRVTLSPKAGGGSQAMERRYLEIWRKENARWLVVRTMDNVG